MTLSETYWLLFTDVFSKNLIFSVQQPIINFVLVYFGHSSTWVIVVSVLGSSLAMIFNYVLGMVVSNLCKSFIDTKLKNYDVFRNLFDKFYYIIIPVFAFLGLLKVLTVTIGFMRLPIIKIFIAIFVTNIMYYSFIILI